MITCLKSVVSTNKKCTSAPIKKSVLKTFQDRGERICCFLSYKKETVNTNTHLNLKLSLLAQSHRSSMAYQTITYKYIPILFGKYTYQIKSNRKTCTYPWSLVLITKNRLQWRAQLLLGNTILQIDNNYFTHKTVSNSHQLAIALTW